MKQEEKELLLKDLCPRLPCGVKITDGSNVIEANPLICIGVFVCDGKWKPYLRPMSSMTEAETNEYNKCFEEDRDDIMPIGKEFEESYKSKKFSIYSHPFVPMYRHIIWLFKNHFDFMGLIPKGLAIEVTEDMYKF